MPAERDFSNDNKPEREPVKSAGSDPTHPHDSAAEQLSKDMDAVQKGTAGATAILLAEVQDLQRSGRLSDVASELHLHDNAQIVRGQDGTVEHIAFVGDGSKYGPSIDIDVKNNAISKDLSPEVRAQASNDAKDYVTDSLSRSNFEYQERILSPKEQEFGRRLMDAVIDGDLDAITRAGQDIMKDPQLMDRLQSAFGHTDMTNTVQFRKDKQGNPYMLVLADAGDEKGLLVPESGKARATAMDIYLQPDSKLPHPDLDATVKAARDVNTSFELTNLWVSMQPKIAPKDTP